MSLTTPQSLDDLPLNDSTEELLQRLKEQPALSAQALHRLARSTVQRLWREGSFPIAPPAGSVWVVFVLPGPSVIAQVQLWDELPPPVRALEMRAGVSLPVVTFYFSSAGAQVELGDCARPLFRPTAAADSERRLTEVLDAARAANHFAQPPPPGTAWVLTGRPHRVLAHPPGSGKILGLRLTVTTQPLGALDPRLGRYVQAQGAEEGMVLVLLTDEDGGEPWLSGAFYFADADEPHLAVAPRGTA